MRRRSVVEHDGRAFGQRRDQPVPHHPAAGGEVEQPIAGADVAVQAQLLVVRQQHAAGAMDQRLGQAGRAGRIEDRERVIEGQRLRGERRPRAGQPVGPGHGVEAGDGVAEDDDSRRSGQARREIGDDRAGVEALAVVGIRGRREQQLRRDLVEARVGGVGAEVGRAGREDRAARGAGEVQDHRLRHVGDEGRDSVAGADAVAGQRRRGAADAEAQLGAGDHAILGRFVGGDDRRGILRRAAAGEQRVRVVHGDAGEPARVGHRRAVVRGWRRSRGEGEAALAQAGPPERVGLGDRPGVQRPVVVERPPGRRGRGPGERGQVRPGRPRRGRRPQAASWQPPVAGGAGMARRRRGSRLLGAVRRVAHAGTDRHDGARAGQDLAVAAQAQLDAIAPAGLERVLGGEDLLHGADPDLVGLAFVRLGRFGQVAPVPLDRRAVELGVSIRGQLQLGDGADPRRREADRGVMRRSMDSFFGLSASPPGAAGVWARSPGDRATASAAVTPSARADIQYDGMVNPVLGRRMARPS